MKEIIFLILLGVLLFIFTAKTTITFEPFNIKFERPYIAIGYLLIFLGAMFIQLQGEVEKDKIKQDKEIFFDFERDKSK